MLGLFGRTVFHMCPTKCLRTRHTSVTGPTSLPFQLIRPLSTPSDRIRCFIPFSLPRMLEHPPLSSSFRLAVVHISRLQTRHAFVTSSTLIHSQLLCTPSHAAGCLQPPFPPTMTTLCSFTISGFFALTDGNRNNDLRRSRYDSALVCMNSPPIPAQVYTFNPSGVFLPDNTIAYLIGKAYYPPPGDCRPVVIETVEFAPIPGDPSSPAYADNVPDFPYPAVSALGTVSSVPVPQQDGKVDFMITAQDYVCGGMKTSTIMSASALFSLLTCPHHSTTFQMPIGQDTSSMEERAGAGPSHSSRHRRPLLREHSGRPSVRHGEVSQPSHGCPNSPPVKHTPRRRAHSETSEILCTRPASPPSHRRRAKTGFPGRCSL